MSEEIKKYRATTRLDGDMCKYTFSADRFIVTENSYMFYLSGKLLYALPIVNTVVIEVGK